MTVSIYDLTTIAEVKELLGIPSATTDFDAMLQDLVTSASFAIEAITQYDFVYRTRVEDHQYDEIAKREEGGWFNEEVLRLNRKPLRSVTSIVDPAGNTIPASNYSLGKVRGELCGYFPPPFDTNGRIAYWTVTYASGKYANTAAIMDLTTGDWNIQQAVKQVVVDWYRRRGGEKVYQKSVGDLSITYDTKFAGAAVLPVPEGVMAMLAPYMNYVV